jgi:hypothetical protein
VISVRTLKGPGGPEFTMVPNGVSGRPTNCARLTRDLRVVANWSARLTRDLRVVANWSVTDGRSVPSVHLDVVALTLLALGVVFMHIVFISILQPPKALVTLR